MGVFLVDVNQDNPCLLSRPITTPLSGSEKQAMAHLVKCAMSVDSEVPTAHSIAL